MLLPPHSFMNKKGRLPGPAWRKAGRGTGALFLIVLRKDFLFSCLIPVFLHRSVR